MNKKILLASLLSVGTLVSCVEPLPPIEPSQSTKSGKVIFLRYIFARE